MDNEKTTVLLIEDNPGDARLIQEYISESGSDIFRLEHVERLSYGLKFLAECNIGIILLDLSLPDSQGLEGLLKILAKAPDIPVVVLSGIKDEAIAIQAVHEGAQDYLVKGSIDGILLVRLLRHAIERHHLRVALRESESRYRLLADNIADVVWVADEKGRITYASPSVKPLLGYTVEELGKLRIRDILAPDSAEQARRLIRNQMEVGVQQSRSTPLSLTLEHVRKDGSTVWAEVMLSFLLDKKGHFSGIMGATRDISARKMAEEALQRSEEHFRALIENASDAVVILDGNGVVCYESPSVGHVLGYRVVDRIGQSAFEFIHPQDRPNVDRAFSELLQQTDATVSVEFRIRNKDGSWHTIDGVGRNLLHNPAVAGLVVNFRDVTKRKEAEQALRESEEELQAIFDGTRDGMALLDLEGKVIRVNKRILEIGSYSEEEVIGKGVESLKMFTPQSLQEMVSVKEIFFSGREVPSFELEVFTKAGEKLVLEVHLTPLKKGGEIIGSIAVARNITDRKKAEEAQRESETRFRTVFEGTNVSMALIDKMGKPLSINPAFIQMFGYGFEEFCSLNKLKYLYPDNAMVDAGLYTEMLNGKRDHYTVDKRYIRNDGEILWGRQNLSVVRDAEGQPEYFIAMIEDITERKKMEEEVRRLSDAVKMSTESIFIADLEGRIVDANEAALKMFGVTNKPDLIGKGVREIIVAEDMEKAFENMKKALEEELLKPVEYHMVRNDGSMLLAEVSASVLMGKDGEPTGFVAVARDITERKKMEEKLIRLSDAVKMSTDSIVLTDLQGNLIEANEATLKMQGAKSRDELIGLKPFDTIVPEDREKAFADLAAIVEKGSVSEVRYHVETRDGRIILLEVSASFIKDRNGVATGIVAVSRDITERKRMEEALRQSEEQFRALVENALDAIVVTNGDGVITYASPSNERMLGYQLQQTIGMDGFGFAHPEDMPDVVSAFTKLIEEPGEPVSVELRIRHNDGSWRIVEAVARNLLEDEAVKGVVINWRDITERKEAEEALRESEERLRLYFNSVSDVIYSLDREFKVVSVSPSVERMLGYKPEELVGKCFPDINILTPETQKRAFVEIMRVMAGEDVISEGEFITKNGEIKRGDISMTPLFSPDGKVVGAIGVGRDVTERKRIEQALLESEERFRRLVNNAQDIVFRWSIDKGLEYVSPAVLNITGYSAEELTGNPTVGMELARKGDPIITADYHKVITEGLSMRSREVSFIRKDGKRIHLDMLSQSISDSNGKVIAFEGILRDITERKRIEEALRLSERDYKVLFESTLDGLVVLEAETMKIVLANETAARISGVSSADDLIGLDPFEFIPIDNRDAVRNIVKEEVFEKDLHRIHEYRFYTAEGKEVWVSAVSTRTEYRGRKAALISIRDITERKKAEEDKQKMEEQLRLAGRLAAVGELAAGVAHELNNPIAAVQGYAQLLTAKKDIDESVKKDVDIIYREAQRAGKITKNLLSFARRHEPEKRFISINEALEKTLELSAHQMKMNNIELEVELDQNLPGTMADFHQMQQIFVNIINNAEQAMLDAHGKGKLIARTRKSGDMIEITFTDDGPGIAEENLKRIFDPFFTTKGVGKGTGLGLSICYGLVEAHNGHLYARSKLGEGATFIVEIPIVPEERPAAEAVGIKSKKGSARWRK